MKTKTKEKPLAERIEYAVAKEKREGNRHPRATMEKAELRATIEADVAGFTGNVVKVKPRDDKWFRSATVGRLEGKRGMISESAFDLRLPMREDPNN